MPSRTASARRAAILWLAVLLAAGCVHTDAEVPIEPLVPAAGRDQGLGPGTRAFSSGPGYKGSPSWSPGGERIAFTKDGYVVDEPTGSGTSRRSTTRDFVATDAEWISEDTLSLLGAAPAPRSEKTSNSLYSTGAGEDSLELEKVARGVLAMSPGPAAEDVIFALSSGTGESELALASADGKDYVPYPNPVDGRVAALSLSPDGEEAVLAVRPPGDAETSELRTFDLRTGEGRRVARLGGKQEILGTPQWTGHGLYLVAGKQSTSMDDDGAEPLYYLYRVAPEGGTPEPAPGVGEDFVAASIRVSPDASRLAVIGRLNPKSPTNLYVLDPRSQDLEAMTANEDMEIKTGPDDLAWSPDGESVAIVARGTPSAEPEVRTDPAERLLRDFYNLYEIPVSGEAPR